MSTVANTYETIDKNLEVGIVELRNMSVGKVHTMMTDLENKFLGLDFSALGKLRGLANQVGSLVDLVLGAPARVMDALGKILNDVVNRIMNSPIAGWLGDLFGMLKDLDNKGLKDFLIGELGAGNLGMCDNTDVLQAYFNGIYIPDNILHGLIADLTLGWGNRVCKNATRSQERSSSNRGVMDLIYPYQGTETSRENVFNDFTGITSGYYEYSPNTVRTRAITFSDIDFIKSILHTSRENFRKAVMELPLSKEEKLDMVLHALDNPNPKIEKEDSLERLLEARELILILPAYSKQDSIRASNLPRAKDALGTFFKNIQEVDLNRVQTVGFTDVEKSILAKLKQLKVETNGLDFTARGTTAGSFQNYDFDKLLKVFTVEEVDYIRSQPIDPRTHRYNNMHPTSEVFIDDDRGRLKKRESVKSNQVFGA